MNNEEKEKFMTICFILRSYPDRYKVFLQDLKRSANLGCDEYLKALTKAFDLLVRESEDYDTVRAASSRYRSRGGRGGRGRHNFIFSQKGRGGRGHENLTFSRTNLDDSDEIVAGMDGETFPKILCFGCNFHGHYRSTCPYTIKNATIFM